MFGSGAIFLSEGQEVTLNFHGSDAVTGEVSSSSFAATQAMF